MEEKELETKTCPACDGSGWGGGTVAQSCPTCKGDGKVGVKSQIPKEIQKGILNIK